MEGVDRDAKTEGEVENTTPGKAGGADRPLSDDRRTPDRGGGVFCGRQVPVVYENSRDKRTPRRGQERASERKKEHNQRKGR
jgi:hypothetical protein